jgi:hypothetical protein
MILNTILLSIKELILLILILNPGTLAITCSSILKNWGFENASWNRFTEISYFFGDPDATFELSQLNYNRGDMTLGDIYLLEAAYKGNVYAQTKIFFKNYYKGNELADKMALELIKERQPDALLYLGERMLVHRQYTYAYNLFEAASSANNYDANGYLGFFWYTGILGTKDVERAKNIWAKGRYHHDPLSEYLQAIEVIDHSNNYYGDEIQSAFRDLVCASSHNFKLAIAKLSKVMDVAIKNNQKSTLIRIRRALKCHSANVSGHENDLFKLENDLEEDCY